MQGAMLIQRQQLAARRESALECAARLREVLQSHQDRTGATESSLVRR